MDEKRPVELAECFERFEKMQERHAAALAGESSGNPDLNTMNFERSASYADLRNQVSRVRKLFIDDEHMMTIFRSRLRSILKKEERLTDLVEAYRKQLMESKKRMHRGRSALMRYQRCG